MALVTSVPAVGGRVGSMRCHGIGSSGVTSNRREITEEPVNQVIAEKIYVAVGKDLSKNKSIVLWAVQNSGGKRICIVHVHQPAQVIPVMGAKFPANTLKEEQVRVYREVERAKMHKILDEYLLLCTRMGARAEKLCIEMDAVDKGILELISRHRIKKLVMGAASDRHFSRKIMDLKSKKAIFLNREAPASCHIWFICKGSLVHTREGYLDGSNMENEHLSPPSCSSTRGSNHPGSQPEKAQYGRNPQLVDPARESVLNVLSRYSSEQSNRSSASTSSDTERLSSPPSRLDVDTSWEEIEGSPGASNSQVAGGLLCLSSVMVNRSLIPLEDSGRTESVSGTSGLMVLEDDPHGLSPSTEDGSIDEAYYEQLYQAMAEAQSSRRETCEETFRRQKAEKDAIQAMRRAKASGSLYTEELKKRRDVELALAKEREELENIKIQQNKVTEELRTARNRKSLLESQLAESDKLVNDLEQKIISAVNLLKNYKKEREELQVERDKALREAEELRDVRSMTPQGKLPRFFTDFSFSEIEEATRKFDPALKIGEGGYGSIYKGVLRHTLVAIKTLHFNSLQGPAEFQQEVDVLSKMRHPNLITLVGACPEAWTLVYEYLPNGSLEDRLNCKENSAPLSWQTRVCIATELCAVLVFLHSSKPHSIVHGDLKPSNLLLDANYVSKLSDFGICRLLGTSGNTSSDTTLYCRTSPKGTFAYIDPELLQTGELSPKSDVYSFGVILLRLLTGMPATGIIKEVKYALDTGRLKTILDPLAGDWPFVQAEQLVRLALRCCEINRKNRPDLATEGLRILEPMRASCGGSNSFRLGPKAHFQPPLYFICPILQEVMQDPHVAADGYTYEGEGLRAWLESGHETSPMTGEKLAHKNMVQNHALRSAVQEWLQQH